MLSVDLHSADLLKKIMSLRGGFTLGEWTIYPLEGRLLKGETEERIQPKSMDVLLFLAEHAGAVVEREAILQKVWGEQAPSDEPLTRCIGDLRRALCDTSANPNYILTVPKRGYKLLAAVEPLEKNVAGIADKQSAKNTADKRLDADKDRRGSNIPRTFPRLGRRIIVVVLLALAVLLADRFLLREDGQDASQVRTSGGPTDAPVVEKSVAVMPFSDLSETQDQKWFADGLAEEILNVLTQTPDVQVLSRTSSFAYEDTDKNVPTIARELGVAHIIVGSVRRAGNRLRVTAQLVRASDGFHLWSQNYDRVAAGVIEIQEDIALQIANALQTTMDPAALAEMVMVGTRSVEAYQEYIRGVATNIEVLGDFGFRRAIDAYESFERARSIDPGFFDAHRQAAMFWQFQLTPADLRYGLIDETPQQMVDKFSSRIDRAIESATNEIDRNLMKAQKAQVELRLREAIRLYTDYLEHRPQDRLAWQALLRTAMFASDRETVVAVLDYYLSIIDSDLSAAIWYVGNAHKYFDPSQSADIGLSALERWPESKALIYQTHRSLLWAMRVDEAATLTGRFETKNEGDRLLEARQACAEGRRNDVLQIIADRRAAGLELNYVDMFLHRLLGDDEEATRILRQYESDEVPYQLATWLHYHIFDPTPFPSLMKILERENIERPPPAKIPYACRPE